MVGVMPITDESSGSIVSHNHDHVWGMTLLEAHDRMWAARGVHVVRTRGDAPPPSGPDLYLLLESDAIVWFDLPKIVRRMYWLKPRALRLRVVDLEEDPYSELVVAGEGDRFERVERGYHPVTRATGRVVLTSEYKLCERCWRQASNASDGWRRIRDTIERASYAVDEIEGEYLLARDPDALEMLLRHWRNPRAGDLDVYQFDTDVWLHDSVRVPEGTTLIGPLWIGAGNAPRSGDVIIGPALIPDEGVCVEPRVLDYSSLRRGTGRLLPMMPLARRSRRVTKRLFDIVFSLCVLAGTLPLYPIIAILILLEDGRPIFFAHERQTIHGRRFPCLKFRTMCRNADSLKEQLAEANQADGPQFFIDDDPRLLRIGKVLRKFQLDELPQFWNVLAGHMSVVGPRPSPDKENQCCPTWREARLSVRPGVTGLWQVRRTREPETDFQEWIQFDLEYVQHQSWKLDLWIIIQTVRHIVGG
ncbi:MAG: sugar transferase [Planctomycetota bacterium]|jgi:lipopolysaccharide/colanic/teichoic acid biosynthesis glycosyltransferase